MIRVGRRSFLNKFNFAETNIFNHILTSVDNFDFVKWLFSESNWPPKLDGGHFSHIDVTKTNHAR